MTWRVKCFNPQICNQQGGFLSLLAAKQLHRCCGGVQKKHVNRPGSPVVFGSGDGRYICKICAPFYRSNKSYKVRTNTRLVNGKKKPSFKWEGQSTTGNSFLQRHHVIVLTMTETGTYVVLRGMKAAGSGMYIIITALSVYLFPRRILQECILISVCSPQLLVSASITVYIAAKQSALVLGGKY